MLVQTKLLASSLKDPLYYLRNLQTVIRWILTHHPDLLLPTEMAALHSLLTLPETSQALLARMVMRKGEHFRRDSLSYKEIPCTDSAIGDLADKGFLDQQPLLTATQVFRLCRSSELRSMLTQRQVALPSPFRKADALSMLTDIEVEEGAQTLSRWWPETESAVVGLLVQPLFDRLQVMFFGNLYQDWSEFVLTELGHQRYEEVAFAPSSRAFQERAEVDYYLALADCQRTLEESGSLFKALSLLPPVTKNPWLSYRRDKVLLQLALQAERTGECQMALALYKENQREDSQVRYLRMLEKDADPGRVLGAVDAAIAASRQPLSHMHLKRIRHRARRKLGEDSAKENAPSFNEESIELQAPLAQRVEYSAAEYLAVSTGAQVFYTENSLFPSLLVLLCWEEFFSPLPGAFFNPFQAGPADLFWPDFVARRETAIQAKLKALESGDYRRLIRKTWQEKSGIHCALIHWEVLTPELLDLCLTQIPAQHLQSIFAHLLKDLRHHRSGMPDLTVFENGSYRLVEVKGPGDRLQDHQRLWLEAFCAMGVDVSVLHVKYGT